MDEWNLYLSLVMAVQEQAPPERLADQAANAVRTALDKTDSTTLLDQGYLRIEHRDPRFAPYLRAVEARLERDFDVRRVDDGWPLLVLRRGSR